jgi:hypothetical protein
MNDTAIPAMSFLSGDDFVKYMITSDPNGAGWDVTLIGARGSRVPAEPVWPGDWLSPYQKVSVTETAWCVDSCLLPDDRVAEIEISGAGFAEPVVIPNPYRDSLLG